MAISINDLFAQLKDKPLAALSGIREKISDNLANSKELLSRQTHQFLYDPAVTIAIFSSINRKQRAKGKVELTSLETAVPLLGQSAFESLCHSVPIYEQQNPVAINLFGYKQAVNRGILAAFFATRLSQKHEFEEIFATSVLFNLAELMLWQFGGNFMPSVYATMQASNSGFDEAFQKVAGFPAQKLSLLLADYLALPDTLIQALEQDKPKVGRVALIHLSNRLAREAEFGWQRPQTRKVMDEMAAFMATPNEQLFPILNQAAIEAANDELGSGGIYAAAFLPMLEGSLPVDARYLPAARGAPASHSQVRNPSVPTRVENTQPASASPARSAQTSAPQGPQATNGTPQHSQQNADRAYKKALLAIKEKLTSNTNLGEMMKLVLEGLHDGLELDRVAFIMLTPDMKTAKTRFGLGTVPGGPLHTLMLDLRNPNLFSLLMKKQQAVWLNPQTRSKFSKLIPSSLALSNGNADFFAMSLFIGEKAIGFLYGDRVGEHSDKELDVETYKHFQTLCLMTSQALTAQAMRKPAG